MVNDRKKLLINHAALAHLPVWVSEKLRWQEAGQKSQNARKEKLGAGTAIEKTVPIEN